MPPTKTYEPQRSLSPSTSRKSSQVEYKSRWTRTPIAHQSQDPLSRFVVFDGGQAPYIEPHFSEAEADPDYDALVEARWYEYLAEHYLKNSGSHLGRAGSGLLVNTPVQLYLAYSRLARARIEIDVYSKLLDQDVGKSLEGDFGRTMKLCLPEQGVYVGRAHSPYGSSNGICA